MFIELLLAAVLANSTVIGSEGITITAISSPTAILNFGGCATNITAPKLPLLVSYTSPNPILCATDPQPGIVKTITAQQQATAYTVTYTLNGATTVVPVPALPPPPPVSVVSTKTCTATITLQTMSDGSTNIVGPFSCK